MAKRRNSSPTLRNAESVPPPHKATSRRFALLRTPRAAYLALGLLILAYIIGYTWMSWHLHATFITSADDLSNIDQVVWNSQNGRILERTTGTRSVPRYGEHVEPIWIALGLLYRGWDDVRALLLAQTIALALGALPVFWWARDAWRRDKPDTLAGLTFAALYLLNPFVTRANTAEVHATPFVVAPMLLALYWGWCGKWKRVIPLALLILLVREDMGVLLIAFGLWTFLRHWQRKSSATPPPSLRAAFGLISAGVAGVAIMLFGIIGTFADERFSGQNDSIFLERYSAFGDSPLAIVGGMLTRWDVWATLFSDPYRLNFLRDFIASTGGLSLFTPFAWLLFAPHFLLNLLSDYFGQYGSLQHYGAPLVPGMMAAAIMGGATLLRWGRHHPAWRVALLVVALGGAFLTARTATGQPLAADWITPTQTDHHRLVATFIAQIPPDAPLSADPQLHPHVAHRYDAYRFPTVGDNAKWILVDVTTNTTRHPADLKTDIEEKLAEGWGVAMAQDGYLLLQRGNPTTTIPADFYSFAHATAPPTAPMATQIGNLLRVEGYTLRQDFWGRVAIEWQLTPLQPLPADTRLDAALLTSEGLPITDTVGQPIPALVWQPLSTWQTGQTYTLRTLPRHPSTPFYPALTLSVGDTPLMAAATARGDTVTPALIAQSRDAWLVGGEWRLVDNHALRGEAGWRRFESPVALNRTAAAWEMAELRAWEVEQEGDTLHLTLTWHALNDNSPAVQRFIHVVPREGAPVPIAQQDGVLGAAHPVSQWVAGEWVQEEISIPLPAEASEWRILVGLYDPATGARWAVTPDAGDSTFALP